MNKENLNKDFDKLPEVLKQQQGKNVFKTPDNYFDGLKANLNSVPSNYPISTFSSITKISSVKYIAAAIISAAIISGSIYLFNRNNDKSEKNLITHKEETISKPINIEENNTDKVKEITTNTKEIQNQTNIIDNEVQNNSISINIKDENKPIENYSTSNNDNIQVINNNNEVISIDNNINDNQLIADNNISTNQTNNQNSQSNSSSIQKNNTITVLDDCYLDSAILIPENLEPSQKHFYRWNTGKINNSLTVFESGKYWVSISGTRSFEKFYTDTFIVKIIPSPQINLGEDKMICSYESINLSSNTQNKHYSYNWNISSLNKPSIILKDLQPGIHNISLEIIACNKSFTDEIEIIVNDCALTIPNVITPNADGRNDYFVIDGLENYSNSYLVIIDRNGKYVFESNNYQNNWDGDGLPSGTYYYILRLRDENQTEKGGVISILR